MRHLGKSSLLIRNCEAIAWNDDGADYKRAYKNLLQNDIMQKCSLVLLGLPPPTQCSSDSCRFGDPDSSGGLGDGDICCPDAWESADVINVELPEIVMQIAKELGLPTIPFREAIGEYHNEVLEAIRSYELADQIHPNEFGGRAAGLSGKSLPGARPFLRAIHPHS